MWRRCSDGGSILNQVAAGLAVAALLAIASAVTLTYKRHRDNTAELKSFRVYFFGTKTDPKTGIPGTRGWTEEMEDRVTAVEKRRRG